MQGPSSVSKQTWLDITQNLPFLKLIGLEMLDIEPGRSKAKLTFRHDLCQPAGIMHGGVIATLIDTGIAHALVMTDAFRELAAEGGSLVSVDLRVKYFRPVSEGMLFCESTIPRMGRQIFHGESVVVNDAGKEVARGDSIYMAISRERFAKPKG